MKVLFVARATVLVGGGHVMRCLTLAQELARRGARVHFAVNAEAEIVAPALGGAGYPVHIAEALEEVVALVVNLGGVDVAIYDSYDCDEKTERVLRPLARKIVVIDDLANRKHDCDLLIDTTYGRAPEDYRGLVPEGAQLLAGACYALLRPEFVALREEAVARRAKVTRVERILVSFGLTDLGGITAQVVAALSALSLNVDIDVVIGARAASRSALEVMVRRVPRLRLHVLIDPPDMARLMADADLAVGAGGATSWERCCLGLPTVLLVLADNQRLVAQKLAAAEAVLAIDGAPAQQLSDLIESVCALVGDTEKLLVMASAAARVVNGDGASAVVAAVGNPFTLRPATMSDAERLFAWRNDPATRAASYSTAEIGWEGHLDWLARSLVTSTRRLYIAEQAGAPVGVVRADWNDAAWELSWTIAPERRGKGVGARVVQMVVEGIGQPVRAEVKSDNSASVRIAKIAGMRWVGETDGVAHFRREASN